MLLGLFPNVCSLALHVAAVRARTGTSLGLLTGCYDIKVSHTQQDVRWLM